MSFIAPLGRILSFGRFRMLLLRIILTTLRRSIVLNRLSNITKKISKVTFILVLIVVIYSVVDFPGNFVILRVKNEIRLRQRPRHSTDLLNTVSILLPGLVCKDELIVMGDQLLHPDFMSEYSKIIKVLHLFVHIFLLIDLIFKLL